MQITARTLDDLLRKVFSTLLKSKNHIRATRGWTTESTAVLLELTNPRARLSRTETKGRLFSCLGELLWYLAKSKSVQFISYYLSRYKEESDDGRTVYGGYGPRLFKLRRTNQIENVLDLLRRKRHSRRAVIQLFDARDLATSHKDVPCTCTMQFMVRRRRLHLLTNMRSNDAFIGLPHDIFAFTMLQEIMARSLRLELGTYYHLVGSLHLYKRNRDSARRYLNEGWQSSNVAMPPMPVGNPWSSIDRVVSAEREIRCGHSSSVARVRLHPFWRDLIRLLHIFQHSKTGQWDQIKQLKSKMSIRLYDAYIDELMGRQQKRQAKRATLP
jgi:thymidylate synthase